MIEWLDFLTLAAIGLGLPPNSGGQAIEEPVINDGDVLLLQSGPTDKFLLQTGFALKLSGGV